MSESKKINPDHYKLPNGIEANDVTMHFGFNEGNVIKYVWRAGKKGGEYRLTDLKKAQWYLNNLVKELESKDEEVCDARVDAGSSHSGCGSRCSDYDRSVCRAYGICPAGLRGFT